MIASEGKDQVSGLKEQQMQQTQENEKGDQEEGQDQEQSKAKRSEVNKDMSNSPAGGFKIEEIKPLAIPMQIQAQQLDKVGRLRDSEQNRNVVKLTYGAGNVQANQQAQNDVSAPVVDLPNLNRNSKKDYSVTSQV